MLIAAGNNYARAVDLLNQVSVEEPQNARVLYYLGLGIREMVERESLAKAHRVLSSYLEMGAPLGHESEVREMLGSRLKPGAARSER